VRSRASTVLLLPGGNAPASEQCLTQSNSSTTRKITRADMQLSSQC